MTKLPLISIVDDDQPFRDSMRRLIRSFGYAVATFDSASAFLESPNLQSTVCLVADVHMPAMSGIELHGHLVESGRTIPTILVTAYPDDRMEARMLSQGVERYLRKPLEESVLIDCLRTAVARE